MGIEGIVIGIPKDEASGRGTNVLFLDLLLVTSRINCLLLHDKLFPKFVIENNTVNYFTVYVG